MSGGFVGCCRVDAIGDDREIRWGLKDTNGDAFLAFDHISDDHIGDGLKDTNSDDFLAFCSDNRISDDQ
jgi:hypothetical protein